tara:strand:- start:603 stop:953 length:351 start_codon:yes stop_codon:yes gene_type:complete
MSELKKIAIGGEMRPIHFGFAALSQWCELSGLGLEDLSDIGNKLSLANAINLIYVGLKHGARKSKEDFDMEADDVADWIDDEGMDVFNEAMNLFADQMAKITPEQKKKKVKAKTKK